MAETAFQGGQAGFDEGGEQYVPRSVLSNSPVSPPVPGITPSVATGAPPAPPAPKPVTPQASPQQLISDPKALQKLGSSGIQDISQLQSQQLALGQAAATETGEATKAQAQSAYTAEVSRTKLQKEIADEQKKLNEQHKKDIQESSAFAPTPETAKDLAGLFSILTVAAFGSGGAGKYHGMQTLSSLTGAMKGYQAGRKDVFERDIKEFDKNLLAIKSHNDKVEKLYNDAMSLLATNKEAGEQKIREIVALDNNGIAARLARSGQYKQLGEAISTVKAALETARDKIDNRNLQYGLLSKRFENEKSLAATKFENEKAILEAKIQGEKDVAKIKAEMKNQSDDVAADLLSRGVRIADKKDRAAVESTVNAMSNLQELKNQVVQDPTLVGRQGQIRQFTDRYIQSFKGGPAVDESGVKPEDQAALRFAKKYASMLTRYEQALAGTARAGSTVFFQKRYNDLLSASQFNPAGMAALMDDMQMEIGREAMTKSPKLTMGILQEMATEFQGRTGEITPEKQVETKPMPSPEKLTAYTKAHPEFGGDENKAKEFLRSQGYK
jgi:hypothetical protein